MATKHISVAACVALILASSGAVSAKGFIAKLLDPYGSAANEQLPRRDCEWVCEWPTVNESAEQIILRGAEQLLPKCCPAPIPPIEAR
ncbi:hypothetical protein [Xanthobacter flavus]|uniref:hypothetical protein n=1 Tax=Xanthobacter flavus TaxID=281 RepID=UPI003728B3E0